MMTRKHSSYSFYRYIAVLLIGVTTSTFSSSPSIKVTAATTIAESPVCGCEDNVSCPSVSVPTSSAKLPKKTPSPITVESDQKQQEQQVGSSQQHSECSLYFAPSTIPEAGWGLFTAKDLEKKELIGGSKEAAIDLILPIMDTYKTYPWRGNQKFLPWLAYVWPGAAEEFYHADKAAFPHIPTGMYQVDEGLTHASDLIRFYDSHLPSPFNHNGDPHQKSDYQRMSAITPGLALQMNSHEEWDNVYFVYDKNSFGHVAMSEDDLGIDYDDDVNEQGSIFLQEERRTWYSHQGLKTQHALKAGSELFLYYGEGYHDYLEEKRTDNKRYETLDEYMKKLDFSQLNTEADKRWLLNTTSMMLRADYNASFEVREPNLGAKFLAVEQHVEEVHYGEERPRRDIKWLQENGVCVDQLIVKESKIEDAGMGAFARYGFAKGQVVSHAPLLHLKRDDMNIYNVISEMKPGRKKATQRLDFDTIEAQELMLNYCFGHKGSEVLLFPYSPMVNYINHNGNDPNTAIRWTDGSKTYLDLHPIDVLEQHGGTLRMEYVALREIAPQEEITIDYGPEWAKAWGEYKNARMKNQTASFRHEIGVPDGFYSENWLNVSAAYEVEPKRDLKAGELQPLVWKHNGKPFTRFAHLVGLPTGISQRFLDYSTDIGVVSTYSKVLKERILDSDEWYVWNATQNSTGENAGQWFTQRYKSNVWHFNMHYTAAWDETARRNFLGEVGRAGFDDVMDGIGNYFGLENMTCFHMSYMGVSECDKSFIHTDVYATGEVSFNIIWPIQLVEGSKPELNLQSDDANLVVAIKYEYDTAVLMGDWGYHFTSAIEGYTGDQKRIVVGMYCGPLGQRNAKMYAHLYDGEDPAPFLGQFEEPFESHWSKGNPKEHRMSRL
jgi:SET domain